MPKKGYLQMDRELQHHWLWMSEPFTKAQAWVDLVLFASFKPGSFFVRGIKVNLKRGQVARKEQYLCERWQWSRTKLRNFFAMLESQNWIKWRRSNVINVIDIINYDKHQNIEGQIDEINLTNLKKLLYRKGKKLLQTHCKDPGALISKWLTNYKSSIPVILNYILEAESLAVENPVSWIESRINPKSKTKEGSKEADITRKPINIEAVNKLTENL